MDPDNIDAWLDYSNILFEKSSPKDAAKLLKDAIALNGDQEELQYRLVAYQISVGDSENAKLTYVKHCRQITKVMKNFSNFIHKLKISPK